MAKRDDRDSSSSIWVTEFTRESAIDFHDQIWGAFRENVVEPIVIHIDSPGGDISALVNMMETMDSIRQSSPDPFFFITYVHGEAMSCALHLLAHGDLRVATPKSNLMFHELSTWTSGRMHQLEVELKECRRVADQLDQIFIEDTEFEGGIEALKDWGKVDQYLTPADAKELGIIDVIGYIRPPVITLTPISIIDLADSERISFRKQRGKKEGNEQSAEEVKEKKPRKPTKKKPVKKVVKKAPPRRKR